VLGIILALRQQFNLVEAVYADVSQGTAGLAGGAKGPGDRHRHYGWGTIMWFNVWFVIWPNQQKALNIGGKYADLAAPEKAPPPRPRHVQPQFNTLLSIPMLFSMVAAGHLY